jgi:hypothetical protein
MSHGVGFIKVFIFQQSDNVSSHDFEDIGLDCMRLVGATIAEKIRCDNIVSSGDEVGDLIKPVV